MLRFGPDTGPVMVLALPLFEEANRTRAFAVTLLRALARRGIAGALPDLPGMGESLVPVGATTLSRMRVAHAAAVDRLTRDGRPCHALAIRSGALVDRDATIAARWHLAPQTGDALLREQLRLARLAGAVPAGSGVDALVDAAAPTIVAGHALGAAMAAELHAALPAAGATRIVRLDGDPRAADRHIAGVPPWRRAEPDSDDALAAVLAQDIAGWAATCAG